MQEKCKKKKGAGIKKGSYMTTLIIIIRCQKLLDNVYNVLNYENILYIKTKSTIIKCFSCVLYLRRLMFYSVLCIR